MWLARWCIDQGWPVAILSRGYGSRASDEPRVVAPGQMASQAWSTVGDEPYLLARELPGAPVVVGRDRVRSGLYAHRQLGAQVLILDDGFQHHRLARDLDLALIDATNPFGHGALLPRGILREPPSALQRAGCRGADARRIGVGHSAGHAAAHSPVVSARADLPHGDNG